MTTAKTTSSCESRTRKIEIKDGLIIYTLKCDGIQDFLTYNDTLYQILRQDSLKPFRDDGRLRIKVRRNGLDQNFYLYDLAIACYTGLVKSDTFLDDMQQYFEYKDRNSLSVDHADNHIHNNTALNISLMTRRLNSSKGEISAKVERPSMVISCYTDGKYRVHYERRGVVCRQIVGDVNKLLESNGRPVIVGIPEMTIVQEFICPNAQSYVSCLNNIVDRNIMYKGLDIVSPMRSSRGWNLFGTGGFLDNVLDSIEAQNALANRSEEDFQEYKSERAQ